MINRQTGKTSKLNPDLIVLSTCIVPDPANKKLAEQLCINVSQYGFFQETDPTFNPLNLERNGIFVLGLAHSPQRLENILTQAVAIAGKLGLMFRNGYTNNITH